MMQAMQTMSLLAGTTLELSSTIGSHVAGSRPSHQLARLNTAALVVFLIIITLSASIEPSDGAPALTAVGKHRSSRDRGCYYMLQHYKNGEPIKTDEPCLNCTCENSMLMCYLRVCPYVKPVGDRCLIERVQGECCPRITCPNVAPPGDDLEQELEPDGATDQVDPVPSTTATQSAKLTTTTTTEATSSGNDVTDTNSNGCHLNGTFYQEGAQMPAEPGKSCEVCYCIKGSAACVMQDCALEVSGCTPIYKGKGCCPTRYNCSSESAFTTPRPGLSLAMGEQVGTSQRRKIVYAPQTERRKFWELATTSNGSTTSSETSLRPFVFPEFGRGNRPESTGSGPSCRVANSTRTFTDGERVPTRNKCEHCYCMRGELVCAVQECRPPCDGCRAILDPNDQCCPTRYECAAPSRQVPADLAVDNLYLSSTAAQDQSQYATEAVITTTTTTTTTPTTTTTTASSPAQTEIDTEKAASSANPQQNFTLSDGVMNMEVSDQARTSEAPSSETVASSALPEVSVMTTRQTRPPLKPISPKSSSDEEATSEFADMDKTTKSNQVGNVDGFNLNSEREQETADHKKAAPSEANSSVPPSETNEVLPAILKSTPKFMIDESSSTQTTSAPTSPIPADSIQTAPSGDRRSRPLVVNSPIPGEGSCRYNGKLYQNGQEVKSRHNCTELCMCINSVVYCDEVDCQRTPENAELCQRVEPAEGECCPKYICPESVGTTSATTSGQPQSVTPDEAKHLQTSTSQPVVLGEKQDNSNATTPDEASNEVPSEPTSPPSEASTSSQQESTSAPVQLETSTNPVELISAAGGAVSSESSSISTTTTDQSSQPPTSESDLTKQDTAEITTSSTAAPESVATSTSQAPDVTIVTGTQTNDAASTSPPPESTSGQTESSSVAPSQEVSSVAIDFATSPPVSAEAEVKSAQGTTSATQPSESTAGQPASQSGATSVESAQGRGETNAGGQTPAGAELSTIVPNEGQTDSSLQGSSESSLVTQPEPDNAQQFSSSPQPASDVTTSSKAQTSESLATTDMTSTQTDVTKQTEVATTETTSESTSAPAREVGSGTSEPVATSSDPSTTELRSTSSTSSDQPTTSSTVTQQQDAITTTAATATSPTESTTEPTATTAENQASSRLPETTNETAAQTTLTPTEASTELSENRETVPSTSVTSAPVPSETANDVEMSSSTPPQTTSTTEASASEPTVGTRSNSTDLELGSTQDHETPTPSSETSSTASESRESVGGETTTTTIAPTTSEPEGGSSMQPTETASMAGQLWTKEVPSSPASSLNEVVDLGTTVSEVTTTLASSTPPVSEATPAPEVPKMTESGTSSPAPAFSLTSLLDTTSESPASSQSASSPVSITQSSPVESTPADDASSTSNELELDGKLQTGTNSTPAPTQPESSSAPTSTEALQETSSTTAALAKTVPVEAISSSLAPSESASLGPELGRENEIEEISKQLVGSSPNPSSELPSSESSSSPPPTEPPKTTVSTSLTAVSVDGDSTPVPSETTSAPTNILSGAPASAASPSPSQASSEAEIISDTNTISTTTPPKGVSSDSSDTTSSAAQPVDQSAGSTTASETISSQDATTTTPSSDLGTEPSSTTTTGTSLIVDQSREATSGSDQLQTTTTTTTEAPQPETSPSTSQATNSSNPADELSSNSAKESDSTTITAVNSSPPTSDGSNEALQENSFATSTSTTPSASGTSETSETVAPESVESSTSAPQSALNMEKAADEISKHPSSTESVSGSESPASAPTDQTSSQTETTPQETSSTPTPTSPTPVKIAEEIPASTSEPAQSPETIETTTRTETTTTTGAPATEKSFITTSASPEPSSISTETSEMTTTSTTAAPSSESTISSEARTESSSPLVDQPTSAAPSPVMESVANSPNEAPVSVQTTDPKTESPPTTEVETEATTRSQMSELSTGEQPQTTTTSTTTTTAESSTTSPVTTNQLSSMTSETQPSTESPSGPTQSTPAPTTTTTTKTTTTTTTMTESIQRNSSEGPIEATSSPEPAPNEIPVQPDSSPANSSDLTASTPVTSTELLNTSEPTHNRTSPEPNDITFQPDRLTEESSTQAPQPQGEASSTSDAGQPVAGTQTEIEATPTTEAPSSSSSDAAGNGVGSRNQTETVDNFTTQEPKLESSSPTAEQQTSVEPTSPSPSGPVSESVEPSRDTAPMTSVPIEPVDVKLSPLPEGNLETNVVTDAPFPSSTTADSTLIAKADEAASTVVDSTGSPTKPAYVVEMTSPTPGGAVSEDKTTEQLASTTATSPPAETISKATETPNESPISEPAANTSLGGNESESSSQPKPDASGAAEPAQSGDFFSDRGSQMTKVADSATNSTVIMDTSTKATGDDNLSASTTTSEANSSPPPALEKEFSNETSSSNLALTTGSPLNSLNADNSSSSLSTASPADEFVTSVSVLRDTEFKPVNLTTVIPSIRGTEATVTIPWSDVTSSSGGTSDELTPASTSTVAPIELTTSSSASVMSSSGSEFREPSTAAPVAVEDAQNSNSALSNQTRTIGYDTTTQVSVGAEADYEELADEPGCEYEGKAYSSAQQIPRSHPCDFCFCFRGDIICLQQTCPPPVPHCFETVIDGFCCPRYECPVHTVRSTPGNPSSLTLTPYHAATHSRLHQNGTQTETLRHGSAGSRLAQSSSTVKGCFVDNKLYGVGKVIESASGPCLECRCDRSGMMRCNPKECSPEDPFLQQINREAQQSTLSRNQRRRRRR